MIDFKVRPIWISCGFQDHELKLNIAIRSVAKHVLTTWHATAHNKLHDDKESPK